jgi:gliding motility-associated-like protein
MAKNNTGFIENKGQIHNQDFQPNPEVKYLLNLNNGLNVQLKANSFSYDTYVIEAKAKAEAQEKEKDELDMFRHPFDSIDNYEIIYHFHRIDIELLNANPNPEIIAEDPSEDYLNYYNAVTPEEGAPFVRSFQKVTYKNIYPGIDLEFFVQKNKEQPFKYNFIVHPGADVSQIRLKYNGASSLKLENGQILIETANGNFHESLPESWLLENNKLINAQYKAFDKNIFGFEINEYSKLQTLLIDPVPVIKWATYYGGSGTDVARSIILDTSLNILTSGFTQSSTAIATSGAYQSSYAGNYDVFIVKMDQNGQRIWGTYYGGSNSDYDGNIIKDDSNNLYISGRTTSTAGIATSGSYQSTIGGQSDAFIVKFDNNGQRIWGTYYGGSTYDGSYDIALDYNRNIIITGSTNSSSISSTGAHQTSLGGKRDAFIAKFNPNCQLQWATYYGGSEPDEGNSLCIDSLGNIYLAGITESTSQIASSNAHQTSYGGGSEDVFLVKFDSNGQRQWGTYFGGNKSDECRYNSLDITDAIYLAGFSWSTTNISTSNAYQVNNAGSADGFIAKFSFTGQRLKATYYGSYYADWFNGIQVNKRGDLFIAGHGQSDTGITTSGAYQTSYRGNNGGSPNGYIARFDTSLQLKWCTYFGDTASGLDDIYVDLNNNIYVVGSSGSKSSVATTGAHQIYARGNNDAIIAKFSDCFNSYDTISVTACGNYDFHGTMLYDPGQYKDTIANYKGCDSVITLYLEILAVPDAQFSIIDTSQCLNDNLFCFTNNSTIDSGSLTYYWVFVGKDTSSMVSPSYSYGSDGTYTVHLIATSDNGCTDAVLKTIIVKPEPEPDFSFVDSTLCFNNNLFQISNNSAINSGNLNYHWDFGDGQTSTAINPTHTYNSIDTFKIKLVAISDLNCSDSITKRAIIYPSPVSDFYVIDSTQCLTGNLFSFINNSQIVQNDSLNYYWNFGDMDSSILQNPTHAYSAFDTFEVALIVTSSNYCSDTVSHSVIVYPMPKADYFIWDTSQCFERNAFGFTNTSSIPNGSMDFSWWFGDGGTSTFKDPVYSYTYPDTFDVHLIATSDQGCIDSSWGKLYIHVHPEPISAFSIDDSAQCLNENLFSFTNQSTISSGSFTQNWYFGDGDTMKSLDALHNYSIYDTLSVRLIIISDWFCKDSIEKTVVIHPSPVADFVSDTASLCLKNNLFSFNNLSSIPHGSFSNYWDFGDSSSSILKNPCHTYGFFDTFQVKLLVTSSLNCIDSTIKDIIVHSMPDAAFSIGDPDQCLFNNNFVFNNLSTIPQSVGLTNYWDFGDVNYTNITSPVHTYSYYDTFNIKLLVTSDFNCIDSTERKLFVRPMPQAAFDVSDSSLCLLGNHFLCTNNSTVPYGILNFNWDFGNSEYSVVKKPFIEYKNQDTFDIKLLVSTEYGCKDSLSKSVIVRPMPEAKFDISDSSQCLSNNTFQFNNLSGIYYGTLGYSWTFGDGDSSITKNPNHNYSWFDTFSIRLIATSDYNCRDTLFKKAIVHPMPVASFAINDSDQCLRGNAYHFTNASIIHHGTLHYVWDFGDLNTSTDKDPDHSLLLDDLYTVQLLAISDQDCKDSTEKQVIVYPMPKADFVVNDTTQCLTGNNFKFTNSTSISYGSLTYSWEVGFGQYSTIQAPDTTFRNWGIYPVQLIAKSDQDCIDTTGDELVVYPMPVAAFIFINNCLEDTMYFFDSSFVDSGTVMQWYWDFKNGKTSTNQNPWTIFYDTGQKSVTMTSTTDFGCASDTTRYFVIEAHVSAPELERSTVVDDEYVLIEWEKPLEGILKEYHIERSTDTIWWDWISDESYFNTSYEDYFVDVDEQSYIYRINATDSCDYTGVYSNIGKSILLRVDTSGAYPKLSWTAYEQWKQGVSNYMLQVSGCNIQRTNCSPFQPITNNPKPISFIDSSTNIQASFYCYRVIAYRNGDSLQSVSNVVCIPSEFRLFVPNSFTPNGDGVNDIFLPKGIFVSEYNLQIFNRWGEKLFESDDINTGWDGIFKGEVCPMGTYLYQIKAKGANGKSKELSGTIQLLR